VVSSRVFRFGGIVVSLLCIGYFLFELGGLPTDRLSRLPIDFLVPLLIFASLAHMGLLLALALGYGELLAAVGHGAVPMRQAIAVWGRANLAKYLPGNVFHLAGRQALGARLGWPQGTTAAATIFELALHVLLPCAIVTLALLLAGGFGTFRHLAWLLPVVLGAVLVFAVPRFGRLAPCWCPAALRRLIRSLALDDPQSLVRAVLLHIVFILGMGLLAWVLYSMIERDIEKALLPHLLAIVVASWLVGLITPGAPGGLGVREASLIVLGAPFLDHEALVILALLTRIAALLGEGLLFLVACAQPLTPAAAEAVDPAPRQRWTRLVPAAVATRARQSRAKRSRA